MLKQLREAQRMTQEELADSIGVNPHTVMRWEAGSRRIDSTKLPRLQEVLGLSDTQVMDLVRSLQSPEEQAS